MGWSAGAVNTNEWARHSSRSRSQPRPKYKTPTHRKKERPQYLSFRFALSSSQPLHNSSLFLSSSHYHHDHRSHIFSLSSLRFSTCYCFFLLYAFIALISMHYYYLNFICCSFLLISAACSKSIQETRRW